MWAVAGVLLGLVGVTFFAGFHLGPHAHAVSSVLGGVAAVVLIALAFTGHADALLFTLLGADLAVTGGVSVVAAKGLRERELLAARPTDQVIGAVGITNETLDPDGTVRLRGEVWSATALNPPIPPNTPVHVMARSSLRLEVWMDTGDSPKVLFSMPGAGDLSTPTQPQGEIERTSHSPLRAEPNNERTSS
jgi:membrane-bound ClpP family serine protease